MHPLIIGVGNKARQGKDTICNAIHWAWPQITYKYPHADPLKYWCWVEKLMGPKKDPVVLQRHGEGKRAEDPNVWIKPAHYKMLEDGYPFAMTPDLRYCNEATWIREHGGVLVRVVRLEPDGSQFIDPTRPKDHISEVDLDSWKDWDYTIVARSGDVKSVQEQALRMFEEILVKHPVDVESEAAKSFRELLVEHPIGGV